jgi:cell division protein FtsB
MFENVKLIREIRALKARINTLEVENELLSDKRLDELIRSLDKQNHYEELEEKIKKLETRNQQLREVIKELKK